MITANCDRRFQISTLDEIVDGLAHLRALAITEPTDTRRQALKLNAITRKTQPAIQRTIVGKHLQRQVIGFSNVLRVAGKRDPTKWSLAFTEEWPNVFRNKARYLERIL